MDYNLWMKKGLCALRKVPDGVVFEVKHLFEGHEWEALSRGDRSGFGRFFSNQVRDGKIPNVEKIGRGKDNHTRYVKRKGDAR